VHRLDQLTSLPQSATQAQQSLVLKSAHVVEALKNEWLGRRDSNPDTQIQSLFQVEADQSDQQLNLAKAGEIRQNPQHGRNKDFDFEEETLP
jgi:hypothetical protein